MRPFYVSGKATPTHTYSSIPELRADRETAYHYSKPLALVAKLTNSGARGTPN